MTIMHSCKSAYHMINEALLSQQTTTNAAEAHGLICGFICGEQHCRQSIDLAALINHIDPSLCVNNRKLLINLYQEISQQLNDDIHQFQLLLPDQTQPLSQRATALQHWTEGFLSGLGLSGVQLEIGSTDLTLEGLERCTKIIQIDCDNLDPEHDLPAFDDIKAYLETTVPLIYLELTGQIQGGIALPVEVVLH